MTTQELIASLEDGVHYYWWVGGVTERMIHQIVKRKNICYCRSFGDGWMQLSTIIYGKWEKL